MRPSGAGLGNTNFVVPNCPFFIAVTNCPFFTAVPNCPFLIAVPNCPGAKLSVFNSWCRVVCF